MVQVTEVPNTPQPEDLELHTSKEQSLLKKYEIPIHHLDFDFVKQCEDGKKLERILHVLKSGQEGHFPDLMRAAEKKLAQIKPTSRMLRKSCPVVNSKEIGQDEWVVLSNDLVKWVRDVSEKDQELNHRKGKCYEFESDIRPTRNQYLKPTVIANPKRISSTDYESWDKYDPDTEITKIDLEDEKLKKSSLQSNNVRKTKLVRFNHFATEAEALFEATREKERGSECFKAGEFENALQHYTYSLECKPLAVVYTNRALTYKILKKYNKAIIDCQSALKIEPENFKAYIRLAQCYVAIKEYNLAFETVEKAIEIDPNNVLAQQLANRIWKMCGKNSVNTRLTVNDVEISESTSNCSENCNLKPLKPILKNTTNSDVKRGNELFERPSKVNPGLPNTKPLKPILKSAKTKIPINKQKTGNQVPPQSNKENQTNNRAATKKGYEIISIPGTSKMPPPYYKIVYSKDPDVIKREKQKILARPSLLHMTIVDDTSDDEQQSYQAQITDKISLQNYLAKNRSASIKIRDDPDSFQLDNYKFDDYEPMERNHRPTWSNICEPKTAPIISTEVEQVDNKGGGEPYDDDHSFALPTMEELQCPYTFIETWNSIRKDTTYKQHAEILKRLDFKRIPHVIGYKLDDTMLTTIVNCLHKYFMIPSELDILHMALTNLIRIPRFKMMSMFLDESFWRQTHQLSEFLDQHGRSLPSDIKNIYSSN